MIFALAMVVCLGGVIAARSSAESAAWLVATVACLLAYAIAAAIHRIADRLDDMHVRVSWRGDGCEGDDVDVDDTVPRETEKKPAAPELVS